MYGLSIWFKLVLLEKAEIENKDPTLHKALELVCRVSESEGSSSLNKSSYMHTFRFLPHVMHWEKCLSATTCLAKYKKSK